MKKITSFIVSSIAILSLSLASNEKDTVCPISGETTKGSK